MGWPLNEETVQRKQLTQFQEHSTATKYFMIRRWSSGRECLSSSVQPKTFKTFDQRVHFPRELRRLHDWWPSRSKNESILIKEIHSPTCYTTYVVYKSNYSWFFQPAAWWANKPRWSKQLAIVRFMTMSRLQIHEGLERKKDWQTVHSSDS